MSNLVEALLENNLVQAKKLMRERVAELVNKKLEELKKEIAINYFEQLDEGQHKKRRAEVNLGRERVVNYRIRHGQFQLRKLRSNVDQGGYAARHHGNVGMVRMTPDERQKRRLKARYTSYKKKIKKARIQQKRKISNMRLRAMGLA